MFVRSLVMISLIAALTAQVPSHVQTADYWGGYAGTKVVPANQAAQWLSWVETNASSSLKILPFGVKTVAYSDPNRLQPSDAMYSQDESQYLHTCSGTRVRASASYPGQVLTNPRSRALASAWRTMVLRGGGNFTAVFADDAVGAAYAQDTPCNYSFDQWIQDELYLMQNVGLPVIYNGLGIFDGHAVSKVIALNAAAIGGMQESCYAQLGSVHSVGGWQWEATENTEIRMADAGKYFFCYGRDLTLATQAYASRTYSYASFLLTYDPRTSVLWEYYKTPTGAHVMPESQLVALNPVTGDVHDIAQLRQAKGSYVREYRTCYLAARSVGPCAAAVNSDAVSAHPVSLPGYSRTLVLSGSGVFDGGAVRITNQPPPAQLAPLQATIAFK
ncbi:MAG: hypothetical protein WBD74_07455 [Candidatus Aquilonibacter sp.]